MPNGEYEDVMAAVNCTYQQRSDCEAMSQIQHASCFGTMFPDVLHLDEDRPQSGKVFSVLLSRAGGMWRNNREVSADLNQWDVCQECADYLACYELSLGKLAWPAPSRTSNTGTCS